MKSALETIVWGIMFTFITYALIKLQFEYANRWMDWLLNDSNHSPLVAFIIGVYLLSWLVFFNEYTRRKEKSKEVFNGKNKSRR